MLTAEQQLDQRQVFQSIEDSRQQTDPGKQASKKADPFRTPRTPLTPKHTGQAKGGGVEDQEQEIQTEAEGGMDASHSTPRLEDGPGFLHRSSELERNHAPGSRSGTQSPIQVLKHEQHQH